jgi:hypothetical protein
MEGNHEKPKSKPKVIAKTKTKVKPKPLAIRPTPPPPAPVPSTAPIQGGPPVRRNLLYLIPPYCAHGCAIGCSSGRDVTRWCGSSSSSDGIRLHHGLHSSLCLRNLVLQILHVNLSKTEQGPTIITPCVHCQVSC